MPFTTKRKALNLTSDEKQQLESLRRSRSGEKRETLHAGIILDVASGMSDGAVARSPARGGGDVVHIDHGDPTPRQSGEAD